MAKKYYVVWEGRERGIFEDWASCKKQVDNFSGAKYKSFEDKISAENALKIGANDFFKQNVTKKTQQNATTKKVETQTNTRQNIPQDSIFVDAACSGNPGVMEYRGVDMEGNVLFYQKFEEGTNNIGEFLAIVHALALLQKQELYDFYDFYGFKNCFELD
jgi:ribonuclease HI